MFLFAANTPQPENVWLPLAIMLFFFVTAAAWFYLWIRHYNGLSILPEYETNRTVPWSGVEMLAILAFYVIVILSIPLGFFIAEKITGKSFWPAAKESPAVAEKTENAAREGEDKKEAKTENHPKKQNESPLQQQADEKTVEHPLTQLLKSKKYFALALAFFVGVVVAPFAEEFLFRLLLIGWLEKAETQWREQWQLRSLVIPLSALPILASSLLFASMHFRTASDKLEESNLVFTLAISAIMNLLVVSFAIVLIRMRTGATARDFGWDSRRFFKDIGLGVFSFFLVAVPIFFLQMVLLTYLPKQFAPDPIPLFFFAVVLGLLYQRTHRLVPSIVLHALLNFCSLAVFWFQ